MKRIIVGAASVAVLATASPALAWERYDIRPDPNGTSMSMDGTPIEMRPRYDYDLSRRYRGEIDRDGSVRMRNWDGDRIRGTIDRDGYGRLWDQDGNTYRVRPRW